MFRQTGPAQWFPQGWELDRLIVPMQGERRLLDAYINSLILWTPSSVDGNMFLSEWSNDEHSQFPTVNLNYIGKKRGRLPPNKHDTGQVIQSASLFGVYDIMYIAPTSSLITFGRAPINTAIIGPAAPAAIRGIAVTVAGVQTYLYNAPGPYGTWLLGFLDENGKEVPVTTAQSSEIVPGQYYRAEITATNLFYPNVAAP